MSVNKAVTIDGQFKKKMEKRDLQRWKKRETEGVKNEKMKRSKEDGKERHNRKLQKETKEYYCREELSDSE